MDGKKGTVYGRIKKKIKKIINKEMSTGKIGQWSGADSILKEITKQATIAKQ